MRAFDALAPAERERMATALCMLSRDIDGSAMEQLDDPDVHLKIGLRTVKLEGAGRDYQKPLEAIAPKQGPSDKKVVDL